jgi:hypothetical protein
VEISFLFFALELLNGKNGASDNIKIKSSPIFYFSLNYIKIKNKDFFPFFCA